MGVNQPVRMKESELKGTGVLSSNLFRFTGEETEARGGGGELCLGNKYLKVVHTSRIDI